MGEMRAVWLVLACAVAAHSSGMQSLDTSALSIPSEFELADSPCAFRHDPAVESALQVAAIKVESDKPPRSGSRVSADLRNAAVKSITAYVYTFGVRRDGKTSHFGAKGKDFIYESALARSTRTAVPGVFSPGQTNRTEIWRGRTPGRIEVYPCAVVFNDGTGVGPRPVLRSIQTDRWIYAKSLETLMAELERARDSADPKAALLLRSKQIPRVRTMLGPHGSRIRIGGLGLGHDLEATAKELSDTGQTRSGRQFLSDRLAALRAFRKTLLGQERQF